MGISAKPHFGSARSTCLATRSANSLVSQTTIAVSQDVSVPPLNSTNSRGSKSQDQDESQYSAGCNRQSTSLADKEENVTSPIGALSRLPSDIVTSRTCPGRLRTFSNSRSRRAAFNVESSYEDAARNLISPFVRVLIRWRSSPIRDQSVGLAAFAN